MRRFFPVFLSILGIEIVSAQNFSTRITLETSTTLTKIASYPCDIGWIFWDKHCYKVFNQYNYNGFAATQSCIYQGAYLAKIDSHVENAFLSSLMTSVVYTKDVWVSRSN